MKEVNRYGVNTVLFAAKLFGSKPFISKQFVFKLFGSNLFGSVLSGIATIATIATLATPAHAQPIVLKFGHYGPTADPVHAGALKFKEIVEADSKGAIRVDVFPSEQLGAGTKMIEGTQLGTIEINISGNPFYGGIVPEMSALDIPFLFKSPQHAYEVIDGPLGRELLGKLEAKGMKGLAYWEIGFRNLTNSKRPITKPEDLKGLKLRTTPNPLHVEAFKLWGANPTPMAISEVYLALQTGTVDGQENPTVHIAKNKFQEVQKHMSITRHAFTAAPMVMNLAKFNSLSAEQQQLLMRAAAEGAKVERKMNHDEETTSLEAIRKAGVQVVENVDTAPFRALAYDKVRATYAGKFGDQIINKIDAAAK